MLTALLFIAAIATLLYGAHILRWRHRSPRPLQKFFIGILVLFIAAVFLDGALVVGSGERAVLRVFLAALPGSFVICLVIGMIIQKFTLVPGIAESRRARSAARYDDTSINPATGLPMSGGVGGVDAAGNSWGDGGDNR